MLFHSGMLLGFLLQVVCFRILDGNKINIILLLLPLLQVLKLFVLLLIA